MRGLIVKDSYVLLKQLKVFGLLLIVMAAMPNTFTRGFAIMYASMLPITALSFDEQAKWDYYAAMMPYRKKDLVLSKYLIGMFFTFVTAGVVALSIFVTAAVKGQPTELMLEYLKAVPLLIAAALILMSLNLPLIFKMGAEKGRLVYIALSMLIALGVVGSVEIKSSFWLLDEKILTFGLLAIAIVLLVISMAVSIKVYNSKRY